MIAPALSIAPFPLRAGTDDGISTASTFAPESPPEFPEVRPLTNGCYVSAHAYVQRFRRAYPTEQARLETLAPSRGGVSRKPHTVVLVTWQGRWWMRDDVSGMTSLRLPVESHVSLERIRARAAGHCEKTTAAFLAQGRTQAPNGDHELSRAQCIENVDTARLLLGPAAETFWIATRTELAPVVLFRPQANVVALYDPRHGTALAETTATDSRKIVAAVAERLGYAVERVEVWDRFGEPSDAALTTSSRLAASR